MSQDDHSYKSIRGESEGFLKERGSKFLGFARPIQSEDEAEALIQVIKSRHPKASHHCYAWRLGHPDPVERANDDGEPSGTAGRPILGQLVKSDVTDIMIVVVRYFGGTLLGTSGLIQSYKACAETTLENSRIIHIVEKEIWNMEIDFPKVHILEEWAPQLGFSILIRKHKNTRMMYSVEIEKRRSVQSRTELIAKLMDCYPEEVDINNLQNKQFVMNRQNGK